MLSINLGWGFGVLIGIMIAGPISGESSAFLVKERFRNSIQRRLYEKNNTMVAPVSQNLSMSVGGERGNLIKPAFLSRYFTL